ncbi:MAG: hypothetical protein AMXMBFR84_05600 [Candidatus Hydrogenedentota bacterium]
MVNNTLRERELMATRREFFGRCCSGVGMAALSSLLSSAASATSTNAMDQFHGVPRAKRVIYLFQSGGPSQMDLFDYKPQMDALRGTDLPASIRMGQRLTGMTSGQATFPVAPSIYKFKQHGQSGAWVSELLPYTAQVADDLCIVKSLNTEAINHDPAITYLQTGSQLPGRPSLGSWVSYGIGSENQDMPGFVVLISMGSAKRDAQSLFQRLWGSGFLPSQHQGVNFRAGSDPVLYLTNPHGIDESTRRHMLDALTRLNTIHHDDFADPEIVTRISQYEMAFRMQTSVPELMDVSSEPDSVFDMYGPDSRKPGTFASNCLLARRLAERGVRFIQLYHRDWDHHGNLPRDLPLMCGDVDQPSAALIKDLKARGMLEDTLVIWGGEFGRTVYCQGELRPDDYGRDHHGRCFTAWMAGGGVKPGLSYGSTDEFGYNVVENPVHVHDFNATILHLLGIDHEKLTYRFQGRDFRLTDVHGNVVHDIVA